MFFNLSSIFRLHLHFYISSLFFTSRITLTEFWLPLNEFGPTTKTMLRHFFSGIFSPLDVSKKFQWMQKGLSLRSFLLQCLKHCFRRKAKFMIWLDFKANTQFTYAMKKPFNLQCLKYLEYILMSLNRNSQTVYSISLRLSSLTLS